MLVVNLVQIGRDLMKLLSDNDIKINDYKYLNLYKEYTEMERDGNKISYIVAVLSERYSISESSIYRILQRFNKAVK